MKQNINSSAVALISTPYSLLLYLLISTEERIQSTLYIMGYDIDENIQKNFHNKISIKNSDFKNKSKLSIILQKIKLFYFNRKQIPELQTLPIWGCDHMPYSSGLIGNRHMTLIEDGLANYNESLINVKYNHNVIKRFIYPLLYGPLSVENIYGESKYIDKIILTGLKDIPDIIKDKVEVVNPHILWETSTKSKQTIILKSFNLSNEDILFFKNKKVILLTQPYNTIIPTEDLITIYKNILSKYDSSEVIIKTHPRDTINYKEVFPNIDVFSKPIPMELLTYMGIKFKYGITLTSTAIYSVNCEERIMIGWGAHPVLEAKCGNWGI